MRLIDADKFKEYIQCAYEDAKGCSKTEKYRNIAEEVTNGFLKDIDEQATAYDVDEVIKQLKENVENIEDEEGTHHFVIDSFTAEFIVKAGGVNE